jgi:catechol 2,3-dioxygenase-like lactoylglutathione lyase family enzyme
MFHFIGPLLAVESIERARYFYEQALGMKVQYDFGVNVSFEGNLAIHLKGHFQDLLGGPERFPVLFGANDGELVFESDEIEAAQERLKQNGVEFIHEMVEQPWGQRVMRFYDPDRHVIEIGERMEAVVRRMRGQGKSLEEIQQMTGMPMEFVRNAGTA